jgi:hypothetical protein
MLYQAAKEREMANTTGPDTTRAQHLAWCKTRALEIVATGNATEAFTSMASDLDKHPETEGHIGIQLGMLQLMGGMLNTPADMRRFIEGFN